MRLSWYADTGVAVFSIWQGGTCTGTFRLPITDLPRMVEALQRGPHGDARGEARGPGDARGAAEQRGRAGQRGGQPPEPDTGYSDPGFAAAHAGHPPGHGEEPPREYRDPPRRAGDEYRRTGAHGRYDEEDRQGYREDSLPGGYRSEPDGGHPAPGGYEDDPTGVYRGEVPGHGHQDGPGAGYREADYAGGPLTGRYPVADRHPRYQDDPLTGRYHEDRSPSRYPGEDPAGTGYPEGPAPYPEGPAAYPEDTSGYPEGPAAYPEDTSGYPEGPAAYPEDTSGYPEGPAAYPEDTSGYPEGPAAYPENASGYPASSGNARYSPARPYVTPVPGGTRPAAEGRGRGRRRAADREDSDLSPDSFPYGGPPAEPEPPRRER